MARYGRGVAWGGDKLAGFELYFHWSGDDGRLDERAKKFIEKSDDSWLLDNKDGYYVGIFPLETRTILWLQAAGYISSEEMAECVNLNTSPDWWLHNRKDERESSHMLTVALFEGLFGMSWFIRSHDEDGYVAPEESEDDEGSWTDAWICTIMRHMIYNLGYADLSERSDEYAGHLLAIRGNLEKSSARIHDFDKKMWIAHINVLGLSIDPDFLSRKEA